MGLAQLVNVSISRSTLAISQAGFGIPLILSANALAIFGGDTVRSYSSLTGVVADFNSSTDEYKAASKLFGQTPHPPLIKIGKALAKVVQVSTMTPTAVNNHVYTITINGTNYAYTADGTATVAEIVAGLIALINADGASKVTASGSTTLVLTANTSGIGFSVSTNADPNMSVAATTANVGVVESLTAIRAVDDNFYGIITTLRGAADVQALAGLVEGLPKLFIVSTNDVNCYSAASTTDIAYLLKAANYFRTACLYSSDYANFPEAAWMGQCLPLTPGSETWANKTLAGNVTDALNDTQIAALKGKSCNYYTVLGGLALTLDGHVAAGDWIDITRVIDAITSDMTVGVFGAIVQPSKLPYTNAGISSVQAQVEGVLKKYQKTNGIQPDQMDANGNLIPGYTTSFPNISQISSNDRANRVLNGGTFTAKLAGAIQAANISGNVTV